MKFRAVDTVVTSGAGICNLHCPYCYLNHHSMYTNYHTNLMKAWEDGSYVDRIIKIVDTIAFPDNIVTLRVFGAETSIGAAVVAPNLLRLKEHFQNLDEVFMVTNFTVHIDNLCTMIKVANDNNISHLIFLISVDGIDNSVSENGHNVPSKVYEQSFDYMFKFLRETPLPNIKQIYIQFKPVISVQTLANLDTMEKNIEYMKSLLLFCDNQSAKAETLPVYVKMNLRIPHLAGPPVGSTEDGMKLAQQFRIYQHALDSDPDFRQFMVYWNPYKRFDAWMKYDRSYKFGEPIDKVYPGCGQMNLLNINYNGDIIHCENWINQSDDLALSKLKEVNEWEWMGEQMIKQGIIPQAHLLTEEEIWEKYKDLQYSYNGGTALYDCMNMAAAQELALSGQIDKIYTDNPERVKRDYSGQFSLHCPNRNLQRTHLTCLGDLGTYRTLLNGRGAEEIEWTTKIMKEKYNI